VRGAFRTRIKELTQEIRTGKAGRKDFQRKNGGRTWIWKDGKTHCAPSGDSHEARHLFLAYALFKGTPIEKVEQKVKKGNEADMGKALKILEQFMGPQAVFVIVRKDLPKITSVAAQATHAAFQHGYMTSEYGKPYEKRELRQWAGNGRTLVVLAAKNVKELQKLLDRGTEAGYHTSNFHDTDMPVKERMTSAVIGPGKKEDLSILYEGVKLA